MDKANLESKERIIVTDNAVNMRASFKTSFSGIRIKHALEFNKDNDEEPEDDDEAYQSLENQKNTFIEGILRLFKKKLISCFAHILQLTVKDGLKETKHS